MPHPYVHVPPTTFDVLVTGQAAALEPEDDHHVRRVLRLDRGDGLVLADGAGRQAPARLTEGGVGLDGEVSHTPPPRPGIHVLQGLAKARKVDEVVRAVTELGVTAVTVVAAERSLVQLRGDKVVKVRDRWESIARSAAGQARRPHLPTVAGPIGSRAAAVLADGGLGLVPHVGAERGLREALLDRLGSVPDVREVRIAIGPEGGWTGGEVTSFEAAGFVPVRLSSSVLRTEHAGLVAAAAVAALVGWMD